MTKIEWTEGPDGTPGKSWNPIRGCSPISPGCTNCYAMRQAHRFSGPGGAYEGLTRLRKKSGPVWTGEVRCVPEMLDAPLRWRKSRRVFVNSMSDLFHRDVPFEFIAAVFGVMAACPQHTFQLLTKRPERAREWFAWVEFERGMARPWAVCAGHARRAGVEQSLGRACLADWGPLPNVQLLVSVEDQVSADERISILLDLPATVRGVSYEPALGEVDFYRFLYRDYPKQPDREHLDWIVVGGESGPGARPFDLAWPRSTIMQCKAAGVPCFIKQLGAKPFVAADEMAALLEVDPFDFAEGLEEQGMPTDRCFCMLKDSKGADMSEWPEDLRVREFPS